MLQPSVHHWGIFLLQKKYRQDVSSLKFTSVEDTPEMIQAKLSNKLAIDVSSADICSLSHMLLLRDIAYNKRVVT